MPFVSLRGPLRVTIGHHAGQLEGSYIKAGKQLEDDRTPFGESSRSNVIYGATALSVPPKH
eukprot:9583403-Karenia_brevis.AAC.1